jgi:hypothetical protein
VTLIDAIICANADKSALPTAVNRVAGGAAVI